MVADLKSDEGRNLFLRLVTEADVLIADGGLGQDGPRAFQDCHDINYISLNGLLHAVGRKGERPLAPLNLAGDFGGGSMFLSPSGSSTPIPIELLLRGRARVLRREGRRWHVEARIALRSSGAELAVAEAEIVERDAGHFERRRHWLAAHDDSQG